MRGRALQRPRVLSLCAVMAVLAIAGCSSSRSSNNSVSVTGHTLTIYASQPPGDAGGQTATDVLDAEHLALSQAGARVGKWTVAFVPVHGATISDNARAAVQNQSSIAYLGEIEPGTSQDSVPITNELDLLQVSPTDTAVYLTQTTPTVRSAPGTYYPSNSSYHRTFARVVPTTNAEAKAIVTEMQSLHATHLYVGDDGQDYGAAIAAQVRVDARAAGLSVVTGPSAADAVFWGGNSAAAATSALDKLADQSPSAKLFVPSALYESSFAAGLSASAQRNLYVSSPGFSPSALSPAARRFQVAFRSTYGHVPVPSAIFGYEAMSAVLAVLHEAGNSAGDRATVVHDFLGLANRQSVLGTYSLHNGDTTLAPFVFARLHDGALTPIG